MKTSYAINRPVENTYLVRERDRRRLRELGKVLLVLIPLGALLLVYIGAHLAVLDKAYRIQELERELEELSRRERQLRLEEAYLASPPRLEERARDELGMVPPRREQMIFLEEAP